LGGGGGGRCAVCMDGRRRPLDERKRERKQSAAIGFRGEKETGEENQLGYERKRGRPRLHSERGDEMTEISSRKRGGLGAS